MCPNAAFITSLFKSYNYISTCIDKSAKGGLENVPKFNRPERRQRREKNI